MQPLRIGNLQLQTPLILAPIAGYCDVSYRLIARACGGVGLAVTDLLCPEGVLRDNYRSMRLAETCAADSPLSMQLYGGNADLLCEAAKWAEGRGAHVIDLNMGCPVDKITKRDGGSKLLCDPDKTVGMVERIIKSVKHTPITAKLRLGWDDTCIIAPVLAKRLQDIGVSMITIHGRTTEMKFTGEARLDGIAEVVAACAHVPVIGNGDIKSPQDAARMFSHTKCAGVMIGRGALSQPWIFRDTWSYLTTGVIPPEPSLAEKCRMMRDHFANILHYRTEHAAVMEFRKRITWWAKTINPSKPLKEAMRLINSAADFECVITDFLAWRQEVDAEHEAWLQQKRGDASSHAAVKLEPIRC